MRFAAAILVGTSLTAALFIGCDQQSSTTASTPKTARGALESWEVKVGDNFPDFSLPRAAGGNASLQDFKGKPLVVSFFATWCPPCKAELPHLENEVWQKMKDRGVQVIAVDREEDAETVQAFLKKQPLSFPVLLDKKRELFSKIAGEGIPRLVLVGKDGKIQKLVLGFSEENFPETLAEIEKMLQ